MNFDYTLIERILFYSLGSLVIFLPGEWALCSYLILTHCDLSVMQSGFSPTSTIGYENVIRVVVIPALLLYRLRKVNVTIAPWRGIKVAWLLLACYAGLSAFWSPFRLSGEKVSVYLFTYGLLFLVLTRAVKAGWVTYRGLSCALWGALLVAFIQTYLVGNVEGTIDGPIFAERFTSFTSVPSFAEFLLVISLLLLCHRRSGISLYLSLSAAMVGIVMSGSRSGFIATLAAILIVSVFLGREALLRMSWPVLLRRTLGGLAIGAGVVYMVTLFAPVNRLNELIQTSMTGSNDLSEVGTVAWRLAIYGGAISEISSFRARELIFGRGSGSGGQLKITVLPEFNEDTVDASRVFHDEFLHSLYEWGLVGVILLVAFYAQLLYLTITGGIVLGRFGDLAALSVIPAFTLGLLVENFLADAGDAGGTAFVLIFAFAAVTGLDGSFQRRQKRLAPTAG